MNRRHFARAVVSGVVIATAPLAGCLNRTTARDYIGEAAALLAENDDELAQFHLEQADEETASFDDTTIQGRVEEAFDLLDAAEELEPTDDEREQITTLRQIGEAQLAFADFAVMLVEYAEAFASARGHFEAERFDDALDDFLQLDSEIGALEAALGDVEAAFDEIDRESLEPEALAELEAADGGVTELRNVLSGLSVLVEGFVPFTRGSTAFQVGSGLQTDGDYEGAIDRYDAAISALSEATNIFDAGATSPSADQFGFDRFACVSALFLEATGYLKESAQAELDGDADEAQRHREQAAELFDSGRC